MVTSMLWQAGIALLLNYKVITELRIKCSKIHHNLMIIICTKITLGI